MLVLTRKVGERIRIGEDIIVTVTSLGHGKVRLGIDAPRAVPVLRAELMPGKGKPPEQKPTPTQP
jgi:carbon storage regulator